MRAKHIFMALGIGFFLCVSSVVEAHQLDAYRAIMDTHRYTIQYEDVTPPNATDGNRLSGTFVDTYVRNGEDRCYVHHALTSPQYDLVLDDHHYLYQHRRNTWMNMEEGTVLRSDDNSRVESYRIYGEPLGTCNVLSVIVSPEQKPAGFMDYAFVSGGSLEDGTTYGDYRPAGDTGFHAVRFYFRDGKLVRIKGAMYERDGEGHLAGTACVLDIKSFSGEPDMNLLTIPAGLSK